MSAIAQEFNIKVNEEYIAPIDVIFILDTSGASLTIRCRRVKTGRSRRAGVERRD